MDSINNLRKNINDIDKKIMDLLNERFENSVKVGLVKLKSSINILDTKREDEILEKCKNLKYESQIIEVYKTVMKESKSLQRK